METLNAIAVVIAASGYPGGGQSDDDLPAYLRNALATRPHSPLAVALQNHATVCEGRGWRAVLCEADMLRQLKPMQSPLVQWQLERVIA